MTNDNNKNQTKMVEPKRTLSLPKVVTGLKAGQHTVAMAMRPWAPNREPDDRGASWRLFDHLRISE